MVHRLVFSWRGALLGVLATTLATVGFAIPATAASAPTPINSCGTTITPPGRYALAENLSCNVDFAAIVIRASNVSLTLNGHTLDAGFALVGVLVEPDSGHPLAGVRITGPGTIIDAGSGVALFGGGIANGVTGSLVTGLTVADSAGDIDVSDGATGNTIEGNTVEGPGGNGIVVFEATRNTIEGNTATAVFGEVGIWLQPDGTRNTIMGNTATGYTTDLEDDNPNCDSNVWKGNTFGTASQSCIH